MKQLYEGKAKVIFQTENPEEYMVYFKDDATAFNGIKKDQISGKGVINNTISSLLFAYLEEKGIPTHFIKKCSEREMLVKKVEIIPLEVIIRNYSAGSFSKRYGVEEGIAFDQATFETSYKNDDLGDPLMNTDHAIALKLVTKEEMDQIEQMARMINALLIDFWKKRGIDLIDFKLEFGKDAQGEIILADEISPDTCRLWDHKTKEKLDKDVFRRDLGDLSQTYERLLSRMEI